MTTTFRAVLLIISLLSAGYTFWKIRKSQMLISSAIFWITLSLGFVVLSIFPEIAISGAGLLGIESPANFIFLAVLFVVLIKLFILTIDISLLKTKLELLVGECAIREYEQEQQNIEQEENIAEIIHKQDATDALLRGLE